MLNVMDGLITFVAKYFILIPLVVAIYIFFKQKNDKRQEMLIILFCTGVLSIILAKIGAHLYNDIRPYLSDGTPSLFPHSGDPNGFPSDHTLLSSFLAFVVLYYSKKWGIFLLVVAALIGWARVAAHVHHAVDIIGSFIITALACFVVVKLVENTKVTNMLKLNRHAPYKEKG
jgi:membrane-associated phospholipid phosphatase